VSLFLVNGEASDQLAVTDRGLHYGDGVFETLRVKAGSIDHWEEHIARLQRGCQRLLIPQINSNLLYDDATQLISAHGKNENAVLKLIVTRGIAQRGYKPDLAATPTRIVAIYPFPLYPDHYWINGVRIAFCKTRLACNRRLAGIKHLNRLEQILASSEWSDDEIVEGLMLDKDEHIIEGTMSNLFWLSGGKLFTPDLTDCGVEGIMRQEVLGIAEKLQIRISVGHYFIEDLLSADEIFITNSIHGIWPVRQIEQYSFKSGPITKQLMEAIQ